MKKQPYTDQHFIPQLYLRKFAYNIKTVYVYDKQRSKSYPEGVSEFCYSENIYSVLAKNVEGECSERDKELILEKDYFHSIENEYNHLLNKAILNKDKWLADTNQSIAISDEEKQELARFIVIQFLRMPNQKANVIDLYEGDFGNEARRLFKEGMAIETGNKAFTELDVQYQVEDPASLHFFSLYGNSEIVECYTAALYEKRWEFCVSKDNDILTSDSPITVKAKEKPERLICGGLGLSETEITFPLSKNIILSISDKDSYFPYNYSDCRFRVLSDKKKREYNLLRYACAEKQVYSFDDSSSKIEEMKNLCNNGKEMFWQFLTV